MGFDHGTKVTPGNDGVGVAVWEAPLRLDFEASSTISAVDFWRVGLRGGGPVRMGEVKPTGPLESTKRSQKSPKAKPTKPTESQKPMQQAV